MSSPSKQHATTDKLPTSSLLALPAEVRNQIWETVLVSSTPILVDSVANAQQPALLQVNKQIRHEASGFYYQSNTFHIQCYDFDSKLHRLFRQHSRQHLAKVDGSIENCEVFVGKRPRSWTDLLEWVLAVRRDEKMAGIKVDRSEDRAIQAAAKMFRFAEDRTRSWEEFCKAIEKFMAEVRPVRAGGIAWR